MGLIVEIMQIEEICNDSRIEWLRTELHEENNETCPLFKISRGKFADHLSVGAARILGIEGRLLNETMQFMKCLNDSAPLKSALNLEETKVLKKSAVELLNSFIELDLNLESARKFGDFHFH